MNVPGFCILIISLLACTSCSSVERYTSVAESLPQSWYTITSETLRSANSQCVEPQIGKQLFEVQIGVEVFKLLVSDESTNRTHFVMYPPLGFHELARAEILDGILKFTTENITDEHSVASLFKTLFDTRHETQEVLQLMFGSYPPHFEHEFVGAPLGDREFIFAHKEKELFIVSSAKNLILRRFELRRQSGRDVLVIGRWLSDSELQLQLPTLNESVSLRLLKGFWCAGVS